MSEKIKVGVVGCGNISGIYFKNITERWSWLEIDACSDLSDERAESKVKEYGVRKCTTEEMLADERIDIILNLTTPPVHSSLNAAALNAGKHVYVEKPFALSREDAKKTLSLAREKGLQIGCAPDTFMGAAGQLCRKLIDDGTIGDVVSAMAFMTCPGHERWHPDPEFYYQQGGGPMLDMGPYYLTQLVNCVGPMKRIAAITTRGFKERVIGSEPKRGTTIQVDVPTHQTGAIEFLNGAVATVVMSFDVWKSTLPRIEIHGTKGSLLVPDPNMFRGEVRLYRCGDEDWMDVPLFSHYSQQNARGMGIADMALAIRNGHECSRASGALAAHVLDAMLAFDESSKSGEAVELVDAASVRPEPLPCGVPEGTAWA